MAGSGSWRMGLAALTCAADASAQPSAPTVAVPPGYTMERTGTQDDFAYFEGGWTTRQHRLMLSGEQRGQWKDFPLPNA